MAISWSGAMFCAGLLLLAGCRAAPQAPQRRAIDEMEMVRVPAGEFAMGSPESDSGAGGDEKPRHTVYLDSFWIDRIEVTNAQFAGFLSSLGRYRGACGGHDCAETQREDADSRIGLREGHFGVEPGYASHPVVEVSWYGAQAYCVWAGARLPTEAEWEKAARGTDGRIYPWGDGAPTCRRAEYSTCGRSTRPAGSRPAGASPYGALDMAGNVWEWVADWHDEGYYAVAPARNPPGTSIQEHKVFRGGSWGYPATFIRTAERARNAPSYAGPNLGFRCARSPAP